MARRILAASSALIVLLAASLGLAKDHRDTAGFSFSYPDDWVLLSKLSLDQAPPMFREMVAMKKLDLSQIHVALFHNVPGRFMENLNVVIEPQQLQVNDTSLKQLTKIVSGQYAAVGGTVENLQSRIEKLGPTPAIVMDFDAKVPGMFGQIKQRQIALPSGGKTLIITCSSDAKTTADHAAMFEPILATLQADPSAPPKGFDFSRVLTMAIAGGVAGGVIGGLLGIYNKFFKKKDDEPAEA